MKLKFERFEGIACFSIREKVELPHLRLLAIGLESLVKDLQEPLVVNYSLATIDALHLKTLIDLKKLLAKGTKHKIYWVGKGKGLSDFLEVGLLFSRLGGFKLRQIGERLALEDQVFTLNQSAELLKAEIDKLGGSGDQAQKIIMENQILREQNRILKKTLGFQEERMKLQVASSPSDPEYDQKVKQALEDLKAAYGSEVNL